MAARSPPAQLTEPPPTDHTRGIHSSPTDTHHDRPTTHSAPATPAGRPHAAHQSMLAGAGAGLVSSIVTCPLDVIKTQLQAQVSARGSRDYQGVVETVQRVWARSGVTAFYRGLGPTILGYLPTWGIYFTVYDKVKDALTNGETTDESGRTRWGVHIIAAMTAGATGTLITNPFWLIRTRFMAQATATDPAERYPNTLTAIRSIWTHEGPSAFYKGLAPSLLGVTHVAIQFPLYEKMKVWATPQDGSPLTSSRILVCSAVSKMIASVLTYPHEVLRTRLQVKRKEAQSAGYASTAHPTCRPGSSSHTSSLNPPKPPPPAATAAHPAPPRAPDSLVSVFKTIAKNDGWRGFYRGISINLVRTVPSSAVTILT